jgi:hypothetical protein
MGAASTASDPLMVGASAAVRRFALPEFSATPSPTTSATATGWAVSIDGLIPIIPGTLQDRGGALTLNGSFVTGQADADFYTSLTGGVTFPTPASGTYTPNVDNGLVTFDSAGVLQAVQWQSVLVGLQYYLPPRGCLWIASNYSHLSSDNIASLGAATKVWHTQDWADANFFWDANPALRFGLEYSWTRQTYADNTDATNHRVQFSAFYIF